MCVWELRCVWGAEVCVGGCLGPCGWALMWVCGWVGESRSRRSRNCSTSSANNSTIPGPLFAFAMFCHAKVRFETPKFQPRAARAGLRMLLSVACFQSARASSWNKKKMLTMCMMFC